MRDTPFFSVVVRTHRRPQKLALALESIASQTFRDYEVLLISDDVNDVQGHQVAENFSSKLPALTKLDVEPLGYPACNLYLNAVPEHANGTYYVYLDDDDQYAENGCLRRIHAGLGDALLGITRMQVRTTPSSQVIFPNALWGVSVSCCNVGTPCVCVHRTVAAQCQWGSKHTGDFSFITEAFSKATPRIAWMDFVAVKTQGTPSFGRTEY